MLHVTITSYIIIIQNIIKYIICKIIGPRERERERERERKRIFIVIDKK